MPPTRPPPRALPQPPAKGSWVPSQRQPQVTSQSSPPTRKYSTGTPSRFATQVPPLRQRHVSPPRQLPPLASAPVSVPPVLEKEPQKIDSPRNGLIKEDLLPTLQLSPSLPNISPRSPLLRINSSPGLGRPKRRESNKREVSFHSRLCRLLLPPSSLLPLAHSFP